jgi:pyridoxamine 5'-phosphate oxidase
MAQHLDLAALRQEYGQRGLAESDAPADPIALFESWLTEAVESGLHEPNAMVVATVSPDGSPSSRFVLLKGVDAAGFCFYTNLESRKAWELNQNPRCALLFPWHIVERQVRIEGVAHTLTERESTGYFRTRPRAAQVGAWASPQSRVIADRGELESRVAKQEERFADTEEIPLPPHWGGYRVVPDVIEFWQGRRSRLHDRLLYRRQKGDVGDSGAREDGTTEIGWTRERLAP